MEVIGRIPEIPEVSAAPDTWEFCSVPASLRQGFPDFRKARKCLPKSTRVVHTKGAFDQTSSPVTTTESDSDFGRLPERHHITLPLKQSFPQAEGDELHTVRPKVNDKDKIVCGDIFWQCILGVL